jgi:hypothetical protein
VGFDRPDEADLPRSGRQADATDPAGVAPDGPAATSGRGGAANVVRAEVRGREEYYADQQVRVSAWDDSAVRFRGLWDEYRRRWPPEERPPVDRSGDPPGSWRGEGGRFLDRSVNQEVDAECTQVAARERDRISPALRETESRDPDRHLVGFDRRLKGHDRIKEKVADAMEEKGLPLKDAISLVPDAIRYTFQYHETGYARGVRADIERMRLQGFQLFELRNTWSGEQYKGINSRWADPETGQRFELQFHTRASFEAKQLTHDAYERLRSEQADEFEAMVLEAFQRKVSAAVPVPVGATEVPDYAEGGPDARQGHLLRDH